MKTSTKVVVFFLITSLIMVFLFNAVSDFKTKSDFDQRNELCIVIAEEMKRTVNESSSCTDYYCYYARYAPPAGYESQTETLCICDCKTLNGTIISTQILEAGGPLQ